MLGRKLHGLRGSVKSCCDENFDFGAVPAADGAQIPEMKFRNTTDYDVEGRIIATCFRNPDGSEVVTRHTYDSLGKLLNTSGNAKGQATVETAYFYDYDTQGRLLSVTDSRVPDNPITFRYDEHGRKSALQIFRPEDYRPSTAFAGSPFEVAALGPNLEGGGSATTVYDEVDRPIEIQARDAQGELVSRAVRIFDEQGRVSEERQILDNPETFIPAEARLEILKSPGKSVQGLRNEITQLFGGNTGPHSIAYKYDAQGHVVHTRRQIFNEEQEIETTYNEYGDEASEITRSAAPGAKLLPAYSEVRYFYRYDQHGNWTEKLTSYRSSPDETFKSSTHHQRSLTYY